MKNVEVHAVNPALGALFSFVERLTDWETSASVKTSELLALFLSLDDFQALRLTEKHKYETINQIHRWNITNAHCLKFRKLNWLVIVEM